MSEKKVNMIVWRMKLLYWAGALSDILKDLPKKEDKKFNSYESSDDGSVWQITDG